MRHRESVAENSVLDGILNNNFLRYPGGKRRMLQYLIDHFPRAKELQGRYIEPFVGGGSVYLFLNYKKSLIADLNSELIDLYNGVKNHPGKVWDAYSSFPKGKRSYYKIRDESLNGSSLSYRAARTLYLNRTCFKGMWRHNKNGKFNVGYGGEARRAVIFFEDLKRLSSLLKRSEVRHSDYEETLNDCSKDDFVFLDPPYKPGARDMLNSHYINGTFLMADQERLAEVLIRQSKDRKFRWAMTNSDHPDIRCIYKKYTINRIPVGTGKQPGVVTRKAKEILVTNF